MKLLIVFVSCLMIKNAFSDDKDCKQQLKGVMECFKKKHEDNKASDDKKIEELKGKVNKCFSDSGCSAPDYDNGGSSGQAGSIKEKFKQKFDSQPEAVKKCIKDEFKKVAIKKMNECLAKKNVAPIKEDDADDDLLDDFHGDQSDDAAKQKMINEVAAVGQALRQCSKDKGDAAHDKVVACIKPLKDDFKKEACKRKDECKKTVKVTDACDKRITEVKKALCECKQEKLTEAKKKVEQLQAKGGDVEVEEAKEVMGGDGPMKDFDPDTIDNCYKKNNANPPPELAVLKQIQNGGGKQGGLLGLFKPKVTQKQLQSIHDHIDEELQNKDCAMCS